MTELPPACEVVIHAPHVPTALGVPTEHLQFWCKMQLMVFAYRLTQQQGTRGVQGGCVPGGGCSALPGRQRSAGAVSKAY